MNPLHDKHHTVPAADLIRLLHDTRERTLALIDDLSDAQLEVPPLDIVNPWRWELGHVAYFYEMFIPQMLDGRTPILPGAEDLYDSFKIDHADRWSLPLPSRRNTLDYLQQVLNVCAERLHTHAPSAEETYVYLLSILHEDMHGEAFTYMRQTLGYPAPQPGSSAPTALPAALGGGPWPGDVDIPGGTFQLGARPDLPFVFDNEKWAHPVEVAPFKMARAPVTNAEFAAFVDDHGYERQELWSYQGRVWKTRTRAHHPVYWRHSGKEWRQRHFHIWVPLAAHAPVVHISWYEAEAYCNWAGRRLPTEAEWEMAASLAPTADRMPQRKRRYPWGDDPPTPERANLDSRFLGCVDVGAFAAGDSAYGCRQMAGNIWEWTADWFYPFPGYIVDYPYREYSAPWFGYRKVLKGGAWPTRSRLAYTTYRNFFPPARNDVIAGFRTCAI